MSVKNTVRGEVVGPERVSVKIAGVREPSVVEGVEAATEIWEGGLGMGSEEAGSR